MEKLKKTALSLLFPKICIIVLLVPVSAAMLVYAFAYKNPNPIIVYISYGLSAYTLTVVCERSPEIFKKNKSFY